MISGSHLGNAQVEVYLATGQSNATPAWAAAIQAKLAAEKPATDIAVVVASHPGNWMWQWFTETPGQNYQSDLSLVQAKIAEISDKGQQAVFKGVFWMQGEGDTGSYSEMNLYAARFAAMMDGFRQGLNMNDAVRFSVGLIDANSDPSYDLPENLAGRTRAQVDQMREVLAGLGAGPNGSAADSRGLPRVDAWHLTPAAQVQLGEAMAAAFLDKFEIDPPRNIFFVGGQSNAKIEMANGIRDVLERSGAFSDLEVIWINHSGNALSNWYDTGPGPNYDSDFFDTNGEGAGKLEEAMTAGGNCEFRALFWFQGEGDATAADATIYPQRFRSMLNRLSQDLGTGGNFASSGARYQLAQVDFYPWDAEGIRSAQAAMVAEDSAFASLIDTKDFPRRDGLHLDRPDLYELGRAMANRYLIALGLPPVAYRHHWQAAEAGEWGTATNWNTGSVPASSPDKHWACFGLDVASVGSVHLTGIQSIDSLVFSNRQGTSSWNLSGNGPLHTAGDFIVDGVTADIQTPLRGSANFRGGNSEIRFKESLDDGTLHLGADRLGRNRYVFEAPNLLGDGVSAIFLGSTLMGSLEDVEVVVQADQESGALAQISSGYPKQGLEARLLIQNGATWTQRRNHSRSLSIGTSASHGGWASAGRIEIGGSDGTSGHLHLTKDAGLEIGQLGGSGVLEVSRGTVKLDANFADMVILGGVGVRPDLNAGGAGRGTITLSSPGVIETGRGFHALKGSAGAAGEFAGLGTFDFRGGTLRVIGGNLGNLFGQDTATTTVVSVQLSLPGGVIDTNGFDTVSFAPLHGPGSLTKRGQGRLTLAGANTYSGGTRVEGGALTLEHPLVIGADSTLTVSGGMLEASSLENHGRIRLSGTSLIMVSGPFTNYGVIDILAWDGNLPASLINHGTVIGRESLKIDDIGYLEGELKLTMVCHIGHSYQLQKARDGDPSGPWDAVGMVIEGNGNPHVFTDQAFGERGFYRVALMIP